MKNKLTEKKEDKIVLKKKKNNIISLKHKFKTMYYLLSLEESASSSKMYTI